MKSSRLLTYFDTFTIPSGFISAVGDLNAETKLDAEGNTLRFYVGQKPTSVLTAHYDSPSLERLGKIRAAQALTRRWRRSCVAALAQGMVGAEGAPDLRRGISTHEKKGHWTPRPNQRR